MFTLCMLLLRYLVHITKNIFSFNQIVSDIYHAVCYYTSIDAKFATHTCRPVDGTSMNKECAAIDAVGSMPPL